MPERIDVSMFAPCGMNCIICKKHCNSKESCQGCFSDDTNKHRYCRECKIKACVVGKGFTYCFECSDFPCMLIESLDEETSERYNWSLITNSQDAKEDGVEFFLESDRRYWTCTRCGGVISFHDSECTDCLTKLSDIDLGPYMYFGIIDDFDEQEDYGDFSDGLSYDDILKKYHCVALPDIIINDWWEGLTHMKSYYEKYGRPETALSRWGTTLIPPESFNTKPL